MFCVKFWSRFIRSMATKDNNPGLLSKVAKFVRNPTTNWTDLDKQDPEPDTGYSKQALKEMIERKRQNDFVRRREFDQLRKLRSRDPSAGNPDLAGRPSYFQSSLPSNPDERAMTIKKIDEIEAQMSNQWWQGKNEGAMPPGAAARAGDPAAATVGAVDVRNAAPAGASAPVRLSPMVREATVADQSDFMPTQSTSSFGKHAGVAPQTTPGKGSPAAGAVARPAAKAGHGSGFSNSRSLAIELVDGSTDPDLEEAAIRFANGDNAGAEAGLLNALQGGEVRGDLAQIWTSALFDLYRATGQQARFDSVAIDYAERFGRSAPTWFSMPDLLGIKTSTSVVRTVPSRLVDEPIWRSPSNFGRSSIDELQLALANASPPWFLDWSQMVELEPDAAPALGDLFSEWSSNAIQLRFKGSENLEHALRSCTPSGDKTVSQVSWRLRMDALRIMRLQDEFELAALEYCVTFEVSPPSWQDARCGFQREPADASDAPGNEASGPGDLVSDQEANDGQGLTVPMGFDSAPAAVVELAGEILGEATDALVSLEEARQNGDRLVISCANLIRVDFSAAGSILNWVAMRQAEGCHLQFRDVHRLVGAFFGVIGINEHARVVLRSN